MSYSIKEVFLTLQGEGARAGARSVFVRFAGCNLWDGNPDHRDRGKGACARWCDTDFAKGNQHTLDQLLARMDDAWPIDDERWCVMTGGEPGLQIDDDLVDALHDRGWSIAVETNGTVDNSSLLRVDWLTVSPKLGGAGVLKSGNGFMELKVVLPGAVGDERGWSAAELGALQNYAAWDHLFVQPQDAIDPTTVQVSNLVPPIKPGQLTSIDYPQRQLAEQYQRNLQQCIDWVHKHPQWKLSLQQHKMIGLP